MTLGRHRRRRRWIRASAARPPVLTTTARRRGPLGWLIGQDVEVVERDAEPAAERDAEPAAPPPVRRRLVAGRR